MKTLKKPTLVIATTNLGKMREFREHLGDLQIELADLSAFPDFPEVAEDADSYVENARAKAKAAAVHTGLPALADDSGLEVDALDGRPGVRSARFAVDLGLCTARSDDANNRALLDQLSGLDSVKRSARFRCVLVVAHPDGRECIAQGACEGQIGDRLRGTNGFGYDPVFFEPTIQATFGEIPAAQKRAISHRAVACRDLHSKLVDFLQSPGPQ